MLLQTLPSERLQRILTDDAIRSAESLAHQEVRYKKSWAETVPVARSTVASSPASGAMS